MDRQLYDATEVKSLDKKWTVLVQVFERRKAHKRDNGPLHRNYMVTDMKGTKVPLVAFDKNVALFSNTLMPFKRYKVSNCIIKETPPAYKIVDYQYTWTLHKRALVEPYHDTVPHPLPCSFPFDNFLEFYRYADQERPIYKPYPKKCIKALVIHALPIQESEENSSYRDLVVINEEMIPVRLRVWEDLLADFDVSVYTRYRVPSLVIAYGLKVTTHNCLSLGTKNNVYFLHDPPLNETYPLKEWYATHSAEITRLLQTCAYRDTTSLFHPPRPSEIIPLNHALATIGNVKTVWTEGKLTYLPAQDTLWFEACGKCFTPLDADTDWKIWCPVCQELTHIVVRGDIDVFLSSGTTVIEATIKSPDIDKLLPYTPNELRLAAQQKTLLTKEVEAAIEKKHVITFLKYYDRSNMGQMVRRYPILKIYTEADLHAYHASREEPTETGHPLANTALTAHIGSSSSAPNENIEKQFFTPTTKAVLEEVIMHPTLEQIQSDQPSRTKRMLTFEEGQTVEPNPVIIETAAYLSPNPTPQPESVTISEQTQQITPSKKSKATDDQK